jgi:hypothetical protein
MMSMLLSDLLSQSDTGQYLTRRQVSKFTASEIRQTISSLVSGGHMDLADALSAAGLSLYPDSEDILAISALLSEIKLDWKSAEQLLSQLMTVQAILRKIDVKIKMNFIFKVSQNLLHNHIILISTISFV